MKRLIFWMLRNLCDVDVEELLKEAEYNKALVVDLMHDKDRLAKHNSDLSLELESVAKEAGLNKALTKQLVLEKTDLEKRNDDLSLRLENEIKVGIQAKESLLEKEAALKECSRLLEISQEDASQLKHKLLESDKVLAPLQVDMETSSNSTSSFELEDYLESLQRQIEKLREKYEQVSVENKNLKGLLCNKEATILNLRKELDDLVMENKICDSQDLEGGTIESVDSKDGIGSESHAPEKDQVLVLVDFPEVGVDSPHDSPADVTKRTIDAVYDVENGKEISAQLFFAQPEAVVFKVRSMLEQAIFLGKPKYVCKYCGQMVKVSGHKTRRGMATFFSHLRDSEDCDYKTTSGLTKSQIEIAKYSRCNEGERHNYLKKEIASLLEITSGVSDVKIEHTVKSNHPLLKWRRPDICATYRGKNVVFELQLSTTFVSVMTERDLFYRLNKTHIIWIFNFDENEKYVDLTNMMVKDVYFNNRLNIFVFDAEAQQHSHELGELVLKCNWILPDNTWKFKNGDTSKSLGGKLVKLSDLTFNTAYKPYYVDAELLYFSANPEFKSRVIAIEEENMEIIRALEAKEEKARVAQTVAKDLIEATFQSLVDEYGVSSIVKQTKKYFIGVRTDKMGLIDSGGVLRLPFMYDNIKMHRTWCEVEREGVLELFDLNYSLLATGIRGVRRVEPLGNKYVKYVSDIKGDWLLGVMNNLGERITGAFYSRIDIWTVGKFVAVRDGLCCIFDAFGKELITGCDSIGDLSADGLAEICVGGRKGLIDADCKSVVAETIRLGKGYSKICIDGLWGLELNGNVIAQCVYDELASYKDLLLGIKDNKLQLLDIHVDVPCPVKANYLLRNERKMLLFKVGNIEAFMNLRQQQKARKIKKNPPELKELFVSCVIPERGLLYLSSKPLK
ncbi:DUF6035 family protein [Hoylesella shahii]|uniref:DUF6035 family protein n=1 Tax=Hoylesella shahii TaxID=228603 RepID=UPI0028E3147F|nr:DUF6035 family protein [Hoylesella shahii]